VIVAGPVAAKARAAGFTSIRVLDPWQATAVKDLTVTAVPGKHGVYEITFVISDGGPLGASRQGPPPGCCSRGAAHHHQRTNPSPVTAGTHSDQQRRRRAESRELTWGQRRQSKPEPADLSGRLPAHPNRGK
jgi:hypothetical protein